MENKQIKQVIVIYKDNTTEMFSGKRKIRNLMEELEGEFGEQYEDKLEHYVNFKFNFNHPIIEYKKCECENPEDCTCPSANIELLDNGFPDTPCNRYIEERRKKEDDDLPNIR